MIRHDTQHRPAGPGPARTLVDPTAVTVAFAVPPRPSPPTAPPAAPRVAAPPAPHPGPERHPTGGQGVALGVLAVIGRIFRLINGTLTVVSGGAIAAIAGSGQLGDQYRTWFVLGGIAWALYGLYIAFGRGSYWVSGVFTYVVPVAVFVYWHAGQHLHL